VFLIEKRDGRIKGRTVYNDKPTRDWHDKEDSASPTASLESIFLTSIIAAKEERDIMMADIPNTFIQTLMPELEEDQERVIMKLKGAVLEILVELAPDLYGPYVVLEDGKRVLYLQVYSEPCTGCWSLHYCGTDNSEKTWKVLALSSTSMTLVLLTGKSKRNSRQSSSTLMI
jgi:hypothetical protein